MVFVTSFGLWLTCVIALDASLIYGILVPSKARSRPWSMFPRGDDMSERRRILLQEVGWKHSNPPEGVTVWLQLCGRQDVKHESGMAVVAPDVSSFCVLVIAHGGREMKSSSRACDFEHALEDQSTLTFTVTPDQDIRGELALACGHIERFFFQSGAAFFRSPELIPAK